jgi:hypothetical protein
VLLQVGLEERKHQVERLKRSGISSWSRGARWYLPGLGFG